MHNSPVFLVRECYKERRLLFCHISKQNVLCFVAACYHLARHHSSTFNGRIQAEWLKEVLCAVSMDCDLTVNRIVKCEEIVCGSPIAWCLEKLLVVCVLCYSSDFECRKWKIRRRSWQVLSGLTFNNVQVKFAAAVSGAGKHRPSDIESYDGGTTWRRRGNKGPAGCGSARSRSSTFSPPRTCINWPHSAWLSQYYNLRHIDFCTAQMSFSIALRSLVCMA